jgi:hypothetical protein
MEGKDIVLPRKQKTFSVRREHQIVCFLFVARLIKDQVKKTCVEVDSMEGVVDLEERFPREWWGW